MLKGVMISLVALMVGVSAAKAQDDSVFVDLSVLNGMDGEVSVDNSSGPMFPVVKAAPKKVAKPKIKKAKKVTKPVAKAEPKAEVKVVEAPIEPKQEAIPYVETKEEVVVVDVEPVTAGDVQDNATQPTIPVAEPAPRPALLGRKRSLRNTLRASILPLLLGLFGVVNRCVDLLGHGDCLMVVNMRPAPYTLRPPNN